MNNEEKVFRNLLSITTIESFGLVSSINKNLFSFVSNAR